MASNIQDGVWKNHATGILTLTLSERDAGFLAIALTIWLGWVATQFWNIVKFCIHQIPASSQDQNAFYLQRQAKIRNSSGDAGMAWDSFQLLRSWRKRQGLWKSLSGVAFILITCLLLFSGWATAREFLSLIWTNTGSQVRVHPQDCGNVNFNDPNDSTQARLFQVMNLNQTKLAATYVQQCYGPENDLARCGSFPVTQISWSRADADCPFAEQNICISANSTPYQMDTGLIDSNTALGINASPKDSLHYRRSVTCSPIHNTGFTTRLNISNTADADLYPPDTIMQQFWFGPIGDSSKIISNFTFEYSEWSPFFPFGYDLTTYASNEGWLPNSSFFNRNDASASIFFLTPNHIRYEAPVYDPWFSADPSGAFEEPNNSGRNITYYIPSFYVTTMACIEQHQFCNPNIDSSAGCTALTSAASAISAAASINLNPTQFATALRISYAFTTTTMANSVSGRDAAALLAAQTAYGDIQIPLPIDQWRIEAGNWFSIALAKLQQSIVDYATGPESPDLLPYVAGPASPELAAQCRSQRVVRQAAKQNFNVVAIILVLGIGGLIIGLGLTVDSCVGSCQRRWRKGVERQQQWVHDGTLQLQRFAYEGRGFHEWMDVDGNIPTMDAMQKLPRLGAAVQNENGHVHPDGGVDGYQLADMSGRR